jgi:hypothetical protein
MDPKESFFSQFPKGCPGCGGPKRHITFTSLVKRPKGLLAVHPTLAMIGLAAGGSSHFAECEACHEAFVWQEEHRRWVNADEVRKGARRRVTTERDSVKRQRKDEQIDIGKLY